MLQPTINNIKGQQDERVTRGGHTHTRRTSQRIFVDSWRMTRNAQNLCMDQVTSRGTIYISSLQGIYSETLPYKLICMMLHVYATINEYFQSIRKSKHSMPKESTVADSVICWREPLSIGLLDAYIGWLLCEIVPMLNIYIVLCRGCKGEACGSYQTGKL